MAQPRKIGDVLAQLIARRGYARQQAPAALDGAWQQAVGPRFSQHSRPGQVRRGTLEVTVANNLVAQELGFHKEEIIEKLSSLAPDAGVSDLRFRVAAL
ncbi:MAG TPA: DUF721 domain-containing protein [Pirellulales bacterium]|jgi:predicted nucleic acid-binding Zn ribbon protein